MRSYDIENFEFHINSSVWDAAQDLNAASCVRDLQEVEKQFWTAMVDSYEVELLLSPKKIKGYTCDCWSDARKTPCMHIAAVAAQVRQYLRQKKADKIQKTAARKEQKAQRGKRMTVSSMLHDVSLEDLRAFVVDFSKGNRDFALAFKTRFAAKASIADNPYRKLMEGLLPPKARKDYPLRRSDYLRVRRSLLELRAQARAAQAVGDYRTLVDLLLPVIEFSSPLALASSDAPRRELSDILGEMAQMLQKTQHAGLSPELVDEVTDYLLVLMEHSLFPDTVLVPICVFLSKKSVENESIAQQIQVLFDKAESPIPLPVLLLYNAALIAQGTEAAAQRSLAAFQVEDKAIIQHCALLEAIGFEQAAADTLYYFLEKKTFTGWVERKVEDQLLEKSPKLKRAKFLPSLLVKRFVQAGELRYLLDLKEKSGRRWKRFFKEVQEELIRRDSYDFLVLALAFVGDLTGIRHILKVQEELNLLEKALPILAEQHPDWLVETYLDLFRAHLDTHFGPPAARHIAQSITIVHRKGYAPLAEKITKELLKTHRKRGSLLEELSEIFPRQRRKAVLYSR